MSLFPSPAHTCHFTNFLIPVNVIFRLLINFKKGEKLISKTECVNCISVTGGITHKKNIGKLLYISG